MKGKIMIKITDITPFMKSGWVAMDKSGVWCWYEHKPEIDEKYIGNIWVNNKKGGLFNDLCAFNIAPADDWTKSLIRIDKEKREKLKEEFNNNIQRIMNDD